MDHNTKRFNPHEAGEIVRAIEELYLFVCKPHHHQRITMDPLSQIAAIKAQVVVLKGQATPQPTTNFVTPDVQSALDDLGTTAGVTPAPAPAPVTP